MNIIKATAHYLVHCAWSWSLLIVQIRQDWWMWICRNLKQAGDNENGWLESPYQLKRILRYTKQDSMPTCLPKSRSWTAAAANSTGFSPVLPTSQHSPLCRTPGRPCARALQLNSRPKSQVKERCRNSRETQGYIASRLQRVRIIYASCCHFIQLGHRSPFRSLLSVHTLSPILTALALNAPARTHLFQVPTPFTYT